ncbi:DUF6232 family protein [Longimicrobium sp.]|uniref:DUF6232 family protein n=1 Tax=Longimicrobium sp. TaxID=2029185 RepID=UPI002E36B9CD|nr:DUF6232 family protein [Longimicrobium sp.]HEX6037069.1 DUF6232 family protein [Longimicrobium sp.]
MSTIADAVSQLFGGDKSTRYDHGELKIRANTLVIGDAVYPLRNISTVKLEDLRRPIPLYVWIMGGLGLFLVMTGFPGFLIGGMLLAVAITAAFKTWMLRSAADYSLDVRMNGANTAAVLNDDPDFLKSIALELYEVIELERASNTTFNIDQRVVIDTVTGSTIGITGVQGDLVEQIPA